MGGTLGPQKLLANGLKCSVSPQFCLSLGFIGNQLCSGLEERSGVDRELEMALAGESGICRDGDWSQAHRQLCPPLHFQKSQALIKGLSQGSQCSVT